MASLNEGVPSIGAVLSRETTVGSGTFSQIARVLDIDGPNIDADMEDVTNHSSAGGYEEAAPTVIRTGTIKFDLVWDETDAMHTGTTSLLADLKARTRRAYKVTSADDASTVFFQGNCYVQSVGRPHPVKGIIKQSVTLKVTGQPSTLA